MEIEIQQRTNLESYYSLQPGDTFMLPKDKVVYMKLQDMPFSNERDSQSSVCLNNGHVCGGFREEKVVKVDCHLVAREI